MTATAEYSDLVAAFPPSDTAAPGAARPTSFGWAHEGAGLLLPCRAYAEPAATSAAVLHRQDYAQCHLLKFYSSASREAAATAAPGGAAPDGLHGCLLVDHEHNAVGPSWCGAWRNATYGAEEEDPDGWTPWRAAPRPAMRAAARPLPRRCDASAPSPPRRLAAAAAAPRSAADLT